MVNVTHDGNDWRPVLQIFSIFLFYLFLHFHLLFHINELGFITKFTRNQFNYLCIQTLVDRYHEAKAHTLADHFGKAYIHQVSQFAYTDKLSYLQLIISCIATALFRHALAFVATMFCLEALTTSTLARQRISNQSIGSRRR